MGSSHTFSFTFLYLVQFYFLVQDGRFVVSSCTEYYLSDVFGCLYAPFLFVANVFGCLYAPFLFVADVFGCLYAPGRLYVDVNKSFLGIGGSPPGRIAWGPHLPWAVAGAGRQPHISLWSLRAQHFIRRTPYVENGRHLLKRTPFIETDALREKWTLLC